MLVRGERCLTVMSTFENQILRTLVHVVCNLADPTPKPPGVQSLAGTKGESCCPLTVVVAAGIGSKVQTTALDPIGGGTVGFTIWSITPSASEFSEFGFTAFSVHEYLTAKLRQMQSESLASSLFKIATSLFI